ncbi:MAG: hypothetical protein A3B69_00400, partial [Gammaproteobacteria bacterium RIFCSPHIGHO2_02_FULL_38_33]
MKNMIFKPIEKLVNLYLTRDPEVTLRLRKFDGQSLRVNLIDIEKFFFITFDSGKVRFFEVLESVPQVTIAGRVFSLLQLLLNKEAGPGIVSEFGIQIQGDLFFLQELKEVFYLMEIDWEDVLSPYLGDFFSQRLGLAVKKIKNVFYKNMKLFKKDFSLYIQEELMLFPPLEEVHDWYDEVWALRDDVERIEAKLLILEESS